MEREKRIDRRLAIRIVMFPICAMEPVFAQELCRSIDDRFQERHGVMRFGFVKDGQRHAAKRFDDDEDDLFWAIEIARLLFTDIRLCKWVVGRFEFPTAIASHDPIVLNALDNRARRVGRQRRTRYVRRFFDHRQKDGRRLELASRRIKNDLARVFGRFFKDERHATATHAQSDGKCNDTRRKPRHAHPHVWMPRSGSCAVLYLFTEFFKTLRHLFAESEQ